MRDMRWVRVRLLAGSCRRKSWGARRAGASMVEFLDGRSRRDDTFTLTIAVDKSIPITACDEERRAKQLHDMKMRAGGLIILAAVAFGISHYLSSSYPWLGWVQAFSEAPMVGGLADWFAVT